MEKTKVSLTNFKEFSPDETPSWVMNVIISDIDKEYSKFSEPIFEILQTGAEKTIFELKNPVHVRDVSFIEEDDDTISYHLWNKINELERLKGKGATLRAVVKDLDGNEYISNEINIDDFFI
jgi:putative 4-coumarate coA ligase